MIINVCWSMVHILIFLLALFVGIEYMLWRRIKTALKNSSLMKAKVRPDPYEVKMDTAPGRRAKSILISDRLDIRIRNMIQREMIDILRLMEEIDRMAYKKNVDRILEIAHRLRRLKHRITSHLMELLRKINNFNLLKFIEITPSRRIIKYKRIEEEVTSWI